MLVKIGLANMGILSIMVFNAFQKNNYLYFPSMMYLVISPIFRLFFSVTVLYVLFITAILLQRLLIGERLRVVEITHLREYSWLTFSEFLLSMTTFRDQFNALFLMRFAGLMVLKAGHWLARDRVDLMEETPQLPQYYHKRMTGLLGLLFVFDIPCFFICIKSLYYEGPSCLILFATEFILMFLSLLMISGRYILNLHDAEIGDTWEHRGSVLFYMELIGDLLKLTCCVIFFFATIRYYGFPLHMFRDMLMTGMSFLKRISDLIKYRRAMRELDGRYPTVSVEEINNLTDKTCVICRDEMSVNIKKLACGHYFHLRCLKSWLERQQACPTCRRDILKPPTPIPVNNPVNIPIAVVEREDSASEDESGFESDTDINIKDLENQIKDVRKLLEKNVQSRERLKKLSELQENLKKTTELINEIQAEEGERILEKASKFFIKNKEGDDDNTHDDDKETEKDVNREDEEKIIANDDAQNDVEENDIEDEIQITDEEE